VKHVVHVADYGNPAAGSFIPALFALARRLHDRGQRCSFISRHVEGAVWHDSARENFDGFATASNRFELYRKLWRSAPDLVHVHFSGWAVPATLAGYLRGVRVIWHLHSAMGEARLGIRRALRSAKYALFGGGVHRFVTVSEALRSSLVRLGAPQERTALIRNAVDARHFRPPTLQERRDARAALGIATGARTLLYFGRDIEIKGADILWQSLAGASNVVLIAVGVPEAALREFRSRVPTVAVTFAPDTAPLYWAADTLVMPSRREGAPYTLLEALCCGVPVIASDIPALAEIARDEPLATLVPNDAVALARAIAAPCAELPAAAEAATRFGLERWVREVSELYAA
jgi:glycosyltransferase involved in cell wall biosynthesis